jgi:lysophospholipase L1-like esterase
MLKLGAIEKEWSAFCHTPLYINIVEKLAKEYGLYYLPLQEKIDEAAAKYGAQNILFDGVHPAPAGAVLIAGEWLKRFEKIEEDMKQ